MRARAVVLALAIATAPLGAKAADLVVWWEKGLYPREDDAVREIVAAFEQASGKKAELVFPPITEVLDQTQAALEAGQPPDFLFGPVVSTAFDQWAYEDRLVDLTDVVGPLVSLFDADTLAGATLLNGRTGKRALYALPMGRSTNHIHVWRSLLERAGFTLADVPTQWAPFWSFWCDRVQPAVRKALGRDDIWGVGLAMSVEAVGDTWVEFTQFQYAYGAYWETADGQILVDDPAVRAKLVNALADYTAIYRKGCAPPDAVRWDNAGNNKAFLAQSVVMTANETLSIMNAVRESRPDDYRVNAATIGWPKDVYDQPLAIMGDVYRGAVFRSDRPAAPGSDFVRFLVEGGWLAHFIDFAGDRWLPPMTKLLDAPFWLDPGDPHRMASAIQALTQPHHFDVGTASHKVFRQLIWQKAVHRVAAEGITPETAVDEAIVRIKEILKE
jgi:multiple sugar transport system substrate-binding protein